MKKRIIPILICVVLALAILMVLPDNADAATTERTGYDILNEALALDGTFPATDPEGDGYQAPCPACNGEMKTWKIMTVNNIGRNPNNGDHYYLPYDYNSKTITFYNKQFFQLDQNSNKTVCFHTNGFDFEAAYRLCLVGPSCTLNVMGGGTISNNAPGTRGTLYSNGGTINAYGVTVKSTIPSASTYGEGAVCLYNSSAKVNLWGCTLLSESTPVLISNGALNLYSSTATGPQSELANYGASGSYPYAKLNLVDSTVTGVKVNNGTLTVSGNTQITGEGLSLPAGKTIDPSKLTTGASITMASEGAFTGSGMAAYAKYFTTASAKNQIIAAGNGVLYSCKPGAVMVSANGAVTPTDDVLADWATGSYAYIKLFGDDALAMDGQDILVDLSGFDLTVTGTGNIRVFDSANDAYDKNACGMLINNGSVTVAQSVVAPNGGSYVTVTESNRVSAHRITIQLSTVTLRTSAAGLYYKAQYLCDDVLASKVRDYGVVLSVQNMPGADFATEEADHNVWTAAAEPFKSGITAISGSVFGIMKDIRDAKTNDAYARMPIYANAYVDLGNGPVVGDTVNPGKKVGQDGFSGTALSLYDLMFKLDKGYNSYPVTTRLQLDDFYFRWKEKGMDWDYQYIGQSTGITDAVDNSDIDLKFDEGTTDAECPVCKTKVTWTALTDESKAQNLQGHYYLTDGLEYGGSDAGGYIYNGTKNTTLCLHLNGNDILAKKTRAIFGSSGRVNIMGEGEVAGYNGSKSAGAAVQLNNSVAGNGVYIYGGTWKKAPGAAADTGVVGIFTVGGNLNVYKGATIDATNNIAIKTFVPTLKNVTLGLYGATVNGNVVLEGADPATAYTSMIEFVDCVINGNVQVANYNDVYLAGAPRITSVSLHEAVRLNTKVLSAGASIGIATQGTFTIQSGGLSEYRPYFHGVNAGDVILVRDKALYCGPDYTGDLAFAEGTTDAMCPVCKKVVTWQAVDGTTKIVASPTNNHHYLTKNVVFTANDTSVLAFYGAEYGDYNSCFHLNGHDLTLTDTRFIFGSTNYINVLGTGTVTGSRGDTYNYGSTIQINTSNERGTVNLYGGVYTQSETGKYAKNDYIISISDNGGTVNVHADATVLPNSNGKAVYVGTALLRSAKLGIYGTVEGYVKAAGASKAYVSQVTVDGGKVAGTLDIDGVNAVTVSHAAKIRLLDMEQTALVTMEAMADGADITVKNPGIFTAPHDSAESWAAYFSGYNSGDRIVVKNGALRCKTDFTAKLYPDANGKAFCPVCQTQVAWTELTDTTAVQNINGHYYLTQDLTYNGTGDAYIYNGTKDTSLCLHLNGNDLTATATRAIFGSNGKVNVMGSGDVSGYCTVANRGSAVNVNNSYTTNGVNLYSGTYKKYNGSAVAAAVLGIENVGGTINVYEDARIENSNGLSIYVGMANYRNAELGLYGATVTGGIIKAIGATQNPVNASGVALTVRTSAITAEDSKVAAAMEIAGVNTVRLIGQNVISKLQLAEGLQVSFENLKAGTDITVSADGIFSGVMPKADEWLQYITCADEGDWIIVRDKQFYQEVKPDLAASAPASDADKTALDTTYAGATVKYGETHNHTNSGPYLDDGTGNRYNTGADGKFSLEEWIEQMDKLNLEFAFIVDHGQSIHMYKENFPLWDEKYFVGGTEPGTTITDSKASNNKPHYNMLFDNPADLEAIFFKWKAKYQPISWKDVPGADHSFDYGYRVKYPTFTTEEFGQLAQDVYAQGGLLVHVHPKYDSYIVSDDPMDYWFADYTGLEISTGSGGNMMAKDNNEAYELWVDLLELGKKIFATAGSDRHRLPDITGLSTMYTAEDKRDTYMNMIRTGNIAPGWVGIRMNVNGTPMGGETSFAGQRLQFSVGDIYRCENKDYLGTAPVYVEGHTYRVELYDDGGLLMSTTIDPAQMNYFAVDCDSTAKFYRVVVWDETTETRIGVSNPIWNAAAQ